MTWKTFERERKKFITPIGAFWAEWNLLGFIESRLNRFYVTWKTSNASFLPDSKLIWGKHSTLKFSKSENKGLKQFKMVKQSNGALFLQDFLVREQFVRPTGAFWAEWNPLRFIDSRLNWFYVTWNTSSATFSQILHLYKNSIPLFSSQNKEIRAWSSLEW